MVSAYNLVGGGAFRLGTRPTATIERDTEMKKMIALLVAISLVAGSLVAVAQELDTFVVPVGYGADDVTIKAGRGRIVNQSFQLGVETSAVVTVYRPWVKSTIRTNGMAEYAGDGTTNLWVYSASSNMFNGQSIDSADSVLVWNTASNAWFVTGIQGPNTFYGNNTNVSVVTLDAATYVDVEGAPVYFINSTDTMSFNGIGGSDIQTSLRNMFTGFDEMPVQISVPVGAGNKHVSGTFSRQ